MKPPQKNLGPVILLVIDGVVIGFAGLIIDGLVGLPGAMWIGLLLFLVNLAVAFFAARHGVAAGRNKVTVGVTLAADGALLAVCGLYIGQTDDAPGAALVGLVLALASLIVAAVVVRRRGST